MSRSTYDPQAYYPPSPPPSISRRPPPLRVNTHNSAASGPSDTSIRSAGHSPVKSGFSYNLPGSVESPGYTQSRARPGGLAAIAADIPARVRSPPSAPRSRAHSRNGDWSRRDSNESKLPPPVIRQSSDQEPSRPRKDNGIESPPLGSVFSGREGVEYQRAVGTSSPKSQDLKLFAHHCRLFYFSPSPPSDSASYISSTLASLSPSHRAAYTRLQSSLRSLAHLHHLRVRISSFHALITSTVSSASLSPSARQDLLSTMSKAERSEQAKHFVSTWCTSKTGGVEPFFRGLWGVLRAQSRGGVARGGGGENRVVWEVDDAVFLESGRPASKKAPLHSQEELGFALPAPVRNGDSRSRAISDPFTDARPSRRHPAPPPPSRRHPHSIPNPLQRAPPDDQRYSSNPESPLLPHSLSVKASLESVQGQSRPPFPLLFSEDRVHLLSRQSLSETINGRSGIGPGVSVDPLIEDDEGEPTEDNVAAEEADLNKPRFRLWSFPAHITDQEAESLLIYFPRFISGKNDIHFPFVRPHRGLKAFEEARWDAVAVDIVEQMEPKLVRVPKVEIEDEEGVVRCGTGRMWVGIEPRRPGWEGSRWYRFIRWWRRLFRLA
ncbi:uncharacterized protein IL334_004984 [Kwoniella shivajii]|uniref:Uncharacterized protein n=1 Tax=Kwoniella shivajii TaxID=564305 RepID=A0ABZ1D3A6_9TREE|nr:hypothetical protein IL334_004984 [Kwoniella shivajii]